MRKYFYLFLLFCGGCGRWLSDGTYDVVSNGEGIDGCGITPFSAEWTFYEAGGTLKVKTVNGFGDSVSVGKEDFSFEALNEDLGAPCWSSEHLYVHAYETADGFNGTLDYTFNTCDSACDSAVGITGTR